MNSLETLNHEAKQDVPETKTIQGSSGVIYEHFHRDMGEEVVGTLGEPVGFNPEKSSPHYEEA